jgi:hypothetical protein
VHLVHWHVLWSFYCDDLFFRAMGKIRGYRSCGRRFGINISGHIQNDGRVGQLVEIK